MLPEREEVGRMDPSGGVPWRASPLKKSRAGEPSPAVADPARKQSGSSLMGSRA